MSISTLTTELIRTAKPRRAQYFIWDRSLTGFGLRVMPAGRKSFHIQIMRKGNRHAEKIGEADAMPLKEARARAKHRIATLTDLGRIGPMSPFEAVAELAFHRHERLWKPGTTKVNRDYLQSSILPFFTGRRIAAITRADVEEWFAGLADRPGAANRSAPLLSVIMREAEECGARPVDSNPVLGLRRYRRHKKERVLSRDEMARLGRGLDDLAETHPLQSALIRLIVLTGCRKGELQRLEWKDYRDGHLHLTDSKTGPKKVFLSDAARAVLDGLNTRRSKLVFPPARKRGREGSGKMFVDHLWSDLRREIGLSDVRLHDLRHNFASVAIRQGERLNAIGTMLGHHQPETTLRYIHLDDLTMREAVRTVDGALALDRGVER